MGSEKNILDEFSKVIHKNIRFNSPIPPSTNTYLKKCVMYILKNGKKIPTVHVYLSDEAKAYKNFMKNTINRAKKEYNWEGRVGDFTYMNCKIKAYIPQRKFDCDNLLKCLFDAIKECDIVKDDCMIIPVFEDVIIDKNNPRLEILMETSDKCGVFRSPCEYSDFLKRNCNECSRFSEKRVCSILRDSLENRFREEIELKAFFKNDNNRYSICKSKKEKKCQKT